MSNTEHPFRLENAMSYRVNRDAIDRAMRVAEVVALCVAYTIIGCTFAAAFVVWSVSLVSF